MTLDLTDEEKLALAAELKRTISEDRYPLSPRDSHLTEHPRQARSAAGPRAFAGSKTLRAAALYPRTARLDRAPGVGSEPRSANGVPDFKGGTREAGAKSRRKPPNPRATAPRRFFSGFNGITTMPVAFARWTISFLRIPPIRIVRATKPRFPHRGFFVRRCLRR
jgi:hypothetical protein